MVCGSWAEAENGEDAAKSKATAKALKVALRIEKFNIGVVINI